MRVINPTVYETLTRTWASTASSSTSSHSVLSATKASNTHLSPVQQFLQSRNMASNPSDLGIENTDIKTAAGVSLDEKQKSYVGCVLDLMAGRPSLKKLQLWKDDAVFEDPLTIARGRTQYEAQWYGLETAFSKIERHSALVTSAGNPITMDLTNNYTVKGLGTQKEISSVITIAYDEVEGKITKVQDKWNGSLPEGSIADAFRRLNAVSVPKMVSVPKSD